MNIVGFNVFANRESNGDIIAVYNEVIFKFNNVIYCMAALEDGDAVSYILSRCGQAEDMRHLSGKMYFAYESLVEDCKVC